MDGRAEFYDVRENAVDVSISCYYSYDHNKTFIGVAPKGRHRQSRAIVRAEFNAERGTHNPKLDFAALPDPDDDSSTGLDYEADIEIEVPQAFTHKGHLTIEDFLDHYALYNETETEKEVLAGLR